MKEMEERRERGARAEGMWLRLQRERTCTSEDTLSVKRRAMANPTSLRAPKRQRQLFSYPGLT